MASYYKGQCVWVVLQLDASGSEALVGVFASEEDAFNAIEEDDPSGQFAYVTVDTNIGDIIA